MLYVNTSTDVLLDTVVKLIKSGQPAWFGCDIGAFSDSTRGLMDTELRDYNAAVRLLSIEESLTLAVRHDARHDQGRAAADWRLVDDAVRCATT